MYSKEFREKVLQRYYQGDASVLEIAQEFQISAQSIYTWLKSQSTKPAEQPKPSLREQLSAAISSSAAATLGAAASLSPSLSAVSSAPAAASLSASSSASSSASPFTNDLAQVNASAPASIHTAHTAYVGQENGSRAPGEHRGSAKTTAVAKLNLPGKDFLESILILAMFEEKGGVKSPDACAFLKTRNVTLDSILEFSARFHSVSFITSTSNNGTQVQIPASGANPYDAPAHPQAGSYPQSGNYPQAESYQQLYQQSKQELEQVQQQLAGSRKKNTALQAELKQMQHKLNEAHLDITQLEQNIDFCANQINLLIKAIQALTKRERRGSTVSLAERQGMIKAVQILRDCGLTLDVALQTLNISTGSYYKWAEEIQALKGGSFSE